MAASPSSPRLGEYELLAKIGEGGMGVVHLARGLDGRQVAIKVLRPYVVGDDSGRTRLAREVTSLRRVRSPRVAEVYAADPWGEQPYLVTRYVRGPSLHDHVTRHGPIAERDLGRFARGLAEALIAVHDADVVHRDVKPSNVLLQDDGPVLIDFGLAQLADDSRLTMTGWLLGTPGYLAPEILYGESPSPRGDVHSWASTVVFAATGRGPYGLGPAVAVLDRVRRGEHDLRGLPDWLYGIVAQALLPDPKDRPTAHQLVARLADPPAAPRPGAEQVTSRLPLRTGPRGAAQDGPTAVQPAGPGTAATPGAVRAPSRLVLGAFWVLMSVALLLGFVTAPGVAGVALFLTAWLLRTLHHRSRTLRSWQRSRAARRSDGWLATVCVPWFALEALPAAVVNAVIGLLDGAIVVLIGMLATHQRSLVPLLAAGGLVACIFVWWGPFGRGVRIGGGIVTRKLLPGGVVSGLALVVLVAVVVGIAGWRLAHGPTFPPLPPPPWESQLRSLVSQGPFGQ